MRMAPDSSRRSRLAIAICLLTGLYWLTIFALTHAPVEPTPVAPHYRLDKRVVMSSKLLNRKKSWILVDSLSLIFTLLNLQTQIKELLDKQKVVSTMTSTCLRFRTTPTKSSQVQIGTSGFQRYR